MSLYYTVEEFADDLRVSPRTVRNWIRRGLITAVRIGPRTVRIERSELRKMIRRSPP
ncbi:helix-turn-helix domain-containing protein [Caenispirillum salinarum]|uniref:helix-turn-helix domain-containing protein n=1 Tax=Caenispirillum salinarum TaxID=859058 RepID=UPI001360B53B|nr:helix-turn-helix domain-containing protein [Caenispirillum salinarum]